MRPARNALTHSSFDALYTAGYVPPSSPDPARETHGGEGVVVERLEVPPLRAVESQGRGGVRDPVGPAEPEGDR